MRRLQSVVSKQGACSLPGVSIRFDLLYPLILRAISRGFVTQHAGDYVLNGLRWGFDLGVDVSMMRGKRWFSNYPTAEEAHQAVSSATKERVDSTSD